MNGMYFNIWFKPVFCISLIIIGFVSLTVAIDAYMFHKKGTKHEGFLVKYPERFVEKVDRGGGLPLLSLLMGNLGITSFMRALLLIITEVGWPHHVGTFPIETATIDRVYTVSNLLIMAFMGLTYAIDYYMFHKIGAKHIGILFSYSQRARVEVLRRGRLVLYAFLCAIVFCSALMYAIVWIRGQRMGEGWG
jgi:hypothetical protein